MRLAIGDVVRNRSDMEIGTVAGLEFKTGLVAMRLSGGMTRFASPRDLEIVRRCSQPMTTRHRVAALLVIGIALVAAYIAAHSVQILGGSLLLMSMAALGAYTMLDYAYAWVLRWTGPRRFSV
ncbi:hypothetical protein ACWF94_10235 [Streptomyces sp. NPDC055078]